MQEKKQRIFAYLFIIIKKYKFFLDAFDWAEYYIMQNFRRYGGITMSFKVFIDGKAGTAGLELSQLLAERDDITILEIDEENRKNLEAKLELMKSADLTFLCLPDAAAVEMADAAPEQCRIIDTSTAHRTKDGWTYGMPEIGYRDEIRTSNRVANPGCHATGFIMAARPLVESGIVGKDHPFAATSLTGFSGGGKQMIAEYGDEGRDPRIDSPAQYALAQTHKHLPEMTKYAFLDKEPFFMPIVADYYRGMSTSVPVFGGPGLEKVYDTFADYYKDEKQVTVVKAEEPRIYANEMAGSNAVKIFVYGNDERTLINVCFDNLGKGAAGAAVQNMNIMLGIEELKGLV